MKMNKTLFFSIGVLLTLIQIFFGQLLSINGVVPNLPLILLVFLALYYGGREPLWLALILGIIKDLYYYGHLGITAIIYVLIIYVICYNRHYFFNENLNIILIFVALSTIAVEAYFFTVSFVFIDKFTNFSFVLLLIRLTYNSVISILFYVLSKFDWKKVVQ